MKKIFFASAFILVAFLLFSCKKNSTSSGGGGGSQWTVQGTTYTGTYTSIASGTFGGSNIVVTSDLGSGDMSGDFISIIFPQTPTANATYTVTNGTELSSNVCSLTLHVQSGDLNFFPSAAGTVNVTIVNGKVKATFSNIPVQSSTGGVTASVSGTLTQQ